MIRGSGSFALTRLGRVGLVAGLCLGAAMGAAWAVPPDPQRAFEAQTCAQAQSRLIEARNGNPLISAEEMHQVVLKAHAQVARLCLTKPPRASD